MQASISAESSRTARCSESVASYSSEELGDADPVWDASFPALVAEVRALRKHKDWADKKIDLLIKRVRDAEGPQRLLKEEVRQLRLVRPSKMQDTGKA